MQVFKRRQLLSQTGCVQVSRNRPTEKPTGTFPNEVQLLLMGNEEERMSDSGDLRQAMQGSLHKKERRGGEITGSADAFLVPTDLQPSPKCPWEHLQTNHRIMESLRLERTLKITKPNPSPAHHA